MLVFVEKCVEVCNNESYNDGWREFKMQIKNVEHCVVPFD